MAASGLALERQAGMAQMSEKFTEMGGKLYVEAAGATGVSGHDRVTSGDTAAVKRSNAALG
jgi:hypothetical protein